jgi:hypothetical protein
MLTDEKLTPGVHLLPEPCYTIGIVGSDEGPDFEGGYSHYVGEDEAAEGLRVHLESMDDDDTRVFEIRAEEFRCTQAVSLCGRLFIYEGDSYQAHFIDRQNLTDSMDAYDADPIRWQITPDGAVLCDDKACRTCRPEIDLDPLLVPVPPVAGQLPLLTSTTEGNPS